MPAAISLPNPPIVTRLVVSDQIHPKATIAMRTNQLIYKIVNRQQWSTAEASGSFEGASIDLQDGYIHFSTALQAEETVAKHFAGQSDLLLVAVQSDLLGEALKWETSRGGDLFPHLYGPLNLKDVSWSKELPLDEDGTHQFPAGWSDAS